MTTVNFTGGARKSFQTDSLNISENLNTISELITYLIEHKPENTPDFDGKNLLIAVNGVDSSALDGTNTKLNSNDVVNIIPIIHGGSKTLVFGNASETSQRVQKCHEVCSLNGMFGKVHTIPSPQNEQTF